MTESALQLCFSHLLLHFLDVLKFTLSCCCPLLWGIRRWVVLGSVIMKGTKNTNVSVPPFFFFLFLSSYYKDQIPRPIYFIDFLVRLTISVCTASFI